MALSESERDELRESLQAALGPRGASLFMSTLPSPDDEPASRRDVSDSAQVLRGEIESVRGDIATLTHEVRNLGVRMDAEFVAVRGEMAVQGGRLLSQMWLSSFTAAATAGALVLAAVSLA
jgi:hypothetical protein